MCGQFPGGLISVCHGAGILLVLSRTAETIHLISPARIVCYGFFVWKSSTAGQQCQVTRSAVPTSSNVSVATGEIQAFSQACAFHSPFAGRWAPPKYPLTPRRPARAIDRTQDLPLRAFIIKLGFRSNSKPGGGVWQLYVKLSLKTPRGIVTAILLQLKPIAEPPGLRSSL